MSLKSGKQQFKEHNGGENMYEKLQFYLEKKEIVFSVDKPP